MSGYIALLRGINVGGQKMVAMSDLRALAEAIGLADVRTLLQSGNLVFHAGKRATAPLEKALEAAASKRLGLEIDFMVRTAAEWAAIVAGNPFPREAKEDPGHLLVVCFKVALTASGVKALGAANPGRETLRAKGRELYAYFPDGVGVSKLTPALIERTLGGRGTGRNWNTVGKIAKLLAEIA